MIITPMVRNNICLNAHPAGCAAETDLQIARARAALPFAAAGGNSMAGGSAAARAPKAVLVIGCSTGYGLASRIAAAFGYGAATVGLSYEKEPSDNKTGSAGWYSNREFDRQAAASGLACRTLNMDAFSAQAKTAAIAAARELGIRFDLVVYSLASPVRVDPETGAMYRSVIKPIGADYTGRTVDIFSGRMSDASIGRANDTEIAETVKVMGGEDWALWMDALESAGILAPRAVTVAYSYLGPELSWPIYRDGTIGRAKTHLEDTARALDARHPDGSLRAFVSINKALVTRSSAVIPVIPLYVSTLFKVMKERGIHEDCLDQIVRLFRDRLYRADGGAVPVDAQSRIRVDELEMGDAVQREVSSRMARLDESSIRDLADVEGFREDFLRVHGFAVPGVDYQAEADPVR